jgi:4-amino-4-deoxy-L-arabinose transferase-like glycosyltransferase
MFEDMNSVVLLQEIFIVLGVLMMLFGLISKNIPKKLPDVEVTISGAVVFLVSLVWYAFTG